MPNEDRAVVGHDCVVLLDGATVRTGTGCRHGVPWYVGQLAAAILDNADLGPGAALAEAIERTADQHRSTCDLDHPATPSAAVAILRLSGGLLDYLVLGDTTIVMQRGDSLAVITDDRVNRTAVAERTAADLLPVGSPEKAEALLAMKHAELAVRNRPGGYWVAAADPAVVEHAIVGRVPVGEVRQVVMLSDGAARAVDAFDLLDWPAVLDLLATDGPDELITRVRSVERSDPAGARWPRNKTSDDATAVYLDWRKTHG